MKPFYLVFLLTFSLILLNWKFAGMILVTNKPTFLKNYEKGLVVNIMSCAKYLEKRKEFNYWLGGIYADLLQRKFGKNVVVKYVSIDEVSSTSHIDLGFRSFMWAGKDSFECLDSETRRRLWDMHQSQQKLKLHEKRLVTIKLAGEVFQRTFCDPNKVDIIFDRSKGRYNHGCLTIHFYQGLLFQTRNNQNYNLYKLCEKNTIENVQNRKPFILSISKIFKERYHFGDAFVRVALFGLLEKKFGTDQVFGTKFVKRLGKNHSYFPCQGNDLDTPLCKKHFRFSIDMENSSFDGYVSEKIFTGFLAQTIPVYFGDPNIENLINPRRFIHCSFDNNTIDWLRKQGKKLPSSSISDETILSSAVRLIETKLTSCLEKIERILRNETLYEAMVNEHVFNEKLCAQKPFINFDFADQLDSRLHEMT